MNNLDKFYTNLGYAKSCISKVNEIYNFDNFDLIVEPSAGDGSFFNQINSKKKIAIDIEPDGENIQTQDFFEFTPLGSFDNILVIGNPPFGKVSSLAVKFFNHSAKWANVIAFIIPRTFRKNSIQNRLNLNFHLILDEETPVSPCCFTPKMNVKCCFQIWEKKETPRKMILSPKTHPDFTFLSYGPKDQNNQPTPPEGADLAIRAYGGKIGEIRTTNLDQLRPKSWHFISCIKPIENVLSILTSLDYSSSLNTARQNSMGKTELINIYSNFVISSSELSIK